MAIALPIADGRVIVQRVSDPFEEGDHTPLVWGLDGSLTELVPGRRLGGTGDAARRRHRRRRADAAVQRQHGHRGPRRRRASSCTRGRSTGPNAGATTLVGDIGGWESGTGRLHLSSNGLIVGERDVRRQQRAAVPDPPRRLRRGHGQRAHAGDVRPGGVVRRLRDLPRCLHRVPGRDDPGLDRERQPRHQARRRRRHRATRHRCRWRGRRPAVTSTCSTTGGS